MRFLAGIALATLLQGPVLSEGLMARHQSRVEGPARTPDIHFSPTRHNIADATYHVFTLLTGQLTLTVEGQEPVDVKAGDVIELKGGAMHTFKNTGTVTATIVEVFGKAAKQ